jgi:hypothetical protein
MEKQPDPKQQAYLQAYRGSFTSALRWHHLDALWEKLRQQAGDDWYIYAVGEPPPDRCAHRDQLLRFIEEIDVLLRKEHEEDYCGIVYADNLDEPGFIKIYDPHNLGVVCGYSDNPPPPGWILSKLPPCDLSALQKPTASRKRWWQRLFHP